MSQFHFDPDTYPDLVAREVPGYPELQDAVAAAAAEALPGRILELGTGTGETALRVLARLPAASLIGVDVSPAMLGRAREVLPREVDLRVGRFEEDLPAGPFDLVFSALAVHHLDAEGKRDLFRRVARELAPGGRFVLADVVVPADPAAARVELEEGFDRPDRIGDQLGWLAEAGLDASTFWERGDLAVLLGVC